MRLQSFMIGLVAAAMAAPLAAQEKEAPPEGGKPKDFVLPQAREYRLGNGLEVTMVPYGTLPKVTVTLVLRVGNLNEDAQHVWLADLTGDLMEEGTTSKSAEAIAQAAARMGGGLNIGVGLDQSNIGGDVLAEYAPDMVRLIADVAQHPLFPASELDRLKSDRVRQVSVAKRRPRSLTLEKFRKVLYGDHAYGRIYPTPEMIQGYTIDDIKSFYDANFGAARAHLYVAGVFDAAKVEAAVQEAFSDWKPGPAPTTDVPSPSSSREIYLIDRPGAAQSTVYVGLPVIDPSKKDYIPLQVTNALLGGSFASRITSNIREDKGYTYSPGSTISTRYRDAYWAEIADVTTAVTGASLKEIFFEINRLRNEAPPEDELHGIQNFMGGIFVLQNSSRGGIIGQLANRNLHGLPEDYISTYVQEIYSVTPEEVERIAQTYLNPDKMTIVITGDKATVADQVKEFGPVVP